MREVLGKKLSKGTKKDLDDISTKTGITLKSCRRQVGTTAPFPPINIPSIYCPFIPSLPPLPHLQQPLSPLVMAVASYPVSSPLLLPILNHFLLFDQSDLSEAQI